MTIDSEIRVSDVVYDLTQTSKMQVVDVAADTVAEFRKREDFDLAGYKSHPLFDVDELEPVFTCVYLKGEVGEPGQSYDFPASRLARFPAEEANEELRRVQETIVVEVLEELFATASTGSMASTKADLYDVAAHAGILQGLVDEARELAEVENWDPEPADLRDGETPDDDAHAARNAEQLAMADESDDPERHEPADFGGGETTGVQDLGTFDEEVSE